MGSIVNRGTKSDPKWYVTYKDVTGRWRMVNSKATTKTLAQRFLAQTEERVAQGKVGIPEPEGHALTFEAFLDDWLAKHSKVALTSHDANVSRAKHLRTAFGRLPLSQVNSQRIADLRADMAAETIEDDEGEEVPRWSPSTVNRVLALLRKVLNDAVAWGKLTAAPKVKLLPVPEQPFDYLQKDEAERFLSHTQAAAPNDFALYAAAIYTGARMGELYGLRWPDIDLHRGQITIRRSHDQDFTKSKKVRRVRINRELARVLKEWKDGCPKGDLGLVFSREDGSRRAREKPPEGFVEQLAAARCHEITFHALRHTAASLMVMAGVSLQAVQAILGHSSITVTMKYAHLAPDFMEREADRLSLNVQKGLGQMVVLEGGGSR